MTQKPEPVFTIEGGHNTPYWRSADSKQKLLGNLVEQALEEAREEHGLLLGKAMIETRWHSSGLEPQLEYGEVKVYDRYDVEAAIHR